MQHLKFAPSDLFWRKESGLTVLYGAYIKSIACIPKLKLILILHDVEDSVHF